jgi:hypothetical protein
VTYKTAYLLKYFYVLEIAVGADENAVGADENVRNI